MSDGSATMTQQSPRIYADFHNADGQGRLRLDCAGTTDDLQQQQLNLREGLELILYADDLDAKGQLDELEVEGVVSWSLEEKCWVAVIDWSAIRHASDRQVPSDNGCTSPTNAGVKKLA